MDTLEKLCLHCQEMKILGDFYPKTTTRDKRDKICIECRQEEQRKLNDKVRRSKSPNQNKSSIDYLMHGMKPRYY